MNIKWILFLLLALILSLFVIKYCVKYISERSDNSQHIKNERMTQPHILLVVADDLGYNDVGYHGSDIKTPNIDWLANTGVKLENYYVQPVCTPTRGQLLSGRYQIHTGLQWVLQPAAPFGLSLDNPTIADKLKEAGYSTHFVGKWHVGFYKPDYLPTRRGFDTFFGLQTGSSNHFSHKTTQWVKPFMTGYDLLEDESPANVSKYDGTYSTHLFAERVMDLIRTNNPEKIHTGLQWVLQPAAPFGLSLDNPTIADKLKEAGYSTHFVGKWHVGFYKPDYLPTRRGFDTFFGLQTGSSNHFSHKTTQWVKPFMTGYDLLEDESPANVSKYDGTYSTHLFAERVMDLIRTNNPEKPMFICLSFQAVHAPLQVPDSYLTQYSDVEDERRRNYSGMTSCLDEAMGRLVHTLKQHNIWDNTLLIFSTDNGANRNAGGSNLPLKGGKGSYWEGGIRGVGFIHSPLLGGGRIENGYTVKELIHVTDWFPTLVRLAGGNVANDLDGFDQWDTIKYNKPSPRREILHNIDSVLMTAIKDGTFNNGVYNGPGKASLRVEHMKIVLGYGNQRREIPECNSTAIYLFDIAKDPLERRDISCNFPDVVKIMMKKIEFYMSGMVSSTYPDLDPQANPKFYNGFWQPWVS